MSCKFAPVFLDDDDGGFSDDDEFMDERNDHLTIMEPHIYMKPCTLPDVRQLFNQSDRVSLLK